VREGEKVSKILASQDVDRLKGHLGVGKNLKKEIMKTEQRKGKQKQKGKKAGEWDFS